MVEGVQQGPVLVETFFRSMAVIVYVSIFPQFCLICVDMPISGLFPLFYWCNSMYMPSARVSMCTVRGPAC